MAKIIETVITVGFVSAMSQIVETIFLAALFSAVVQIALHYMLKKPGRVTSYITGTLGYLIPTLYAMFKFGDYSGMITVTICVVVSGLTVIAANKYDDHKAAAGELKALEAENQKLRQDIDNA